MHTSNKEIKELVDHGFVKLQSWLEKRFQQQEDLFRRLGPVSRENSAETFDATVTDRSRSGIDLRSSTVIANTSADSRKKSSTSTLAADVEDAEEDPLRMAARIMGSDIRVSGRQKNVLADAQSPAQMEFMSLPGSAPDYSPKVQRESTRGIDAGSIREQQESHVWAFESPIVTEADRMPDPREDLIRDHLRNQAEDRQQHEEAEGSMKRLQTDFTKMADTSNLDKAAGPPIHAEQDWQSRLMDVFDHLDVDGTGVIDRDQIVNAFADVGPPDMEAFEVLATEASQSDRSNSGRSFRARHGSKESPRASLGDMGIHRVMGRDEWLHMIEMAEKCSKEEMHSLLEFIDRLTLRQKRAGRHHDSDQPEKKKPLTLLRHDRPLRMTWDILMMLLLFYIALSLPYSMGFGQSKTLQDLDGILDFVFCFDILLNFRTSYAINVAGNDVVILDGKKIACRYAKSWFFLDFMSSVPFDLLTAGLMPSFQPARLLKMGKIAKVMKLLKIKQMLKGCEGSEIMVQMEEKSASKASQTMTRLVKLMCLNLLLAHWLACFGATVDNSHLDAYFDGAKDVPTRMQKYLAAVYWAMTTLSTVGYGDILPTTDAERGYAMFAMVVGGAFYGYIIGSVTSIVSDMDLNARAVSNRMDLVQSWLDCHGGIPKSLRRRVRKSYKLTLSEQSALEDSAILTELSPQLRADMAFFIIHEHVRANPMFHGVSKRALANLVMVLQNNYAQENEFIVKVGNPGIAMYTLIDGSARYDRGLLWRPGGCKITGERFSKVKTGDSFGEEIILGLEEDYTYTIIAITACQFHSISEDGFVDQFRSMPSVFRYMYQNFLRIRSKPLAEMKSKGSEGSLALLD